MELVEVRNPGGYGMKMMWSISGCWYKWNRWLAIYMLEKTQPPQQPIAYVNAPKANLTPPKVSYQFSIALLTKVDPPPLLLCHQLSLFRTTSFSYNDPLFSTEYLFLWTLTCPWCPPSLYSADPLSLCIPLPTTQPTSHHLPIIPISVVSLYCYSSLHLFPCSVIFPKWHSPLTVLFSPFTSLPISSHSSLAFTLLQTHLPSFT